MCLISGGREPGIGEIPVLAGYRKSLRSGSPNGFPSRRCRCPALRECAMLVA